VVSGQEREKVSFQRFSAFSALLMMLITFTVIITYLAFAVFTLGLVYRMIVWAKAPVPFRIPTTCGQQKSLPWIKSSRLDNPHSTLGVIGRMALEVLLFRSLFRNTEAELREGPKLVYSSTKWLWLGALAFHWSLLAIVIRHLRFFTEPQPAAVTVLQRLDGFFQVGLPAIYVTDAILLAGLSFLFLRRVVDPKMRAISLAADYFVLLLIGSIAVTGILLRHFYKTDLRAVKEFAMSLLRLHPALPAEPGVLFYTHLLLVSALLIYFPFSKLVHMGAVFLSPTRNLANDNRARRHVNPWNAPVKTHTYEEYENEFREVMKAAELPVDK
jgi:nitrate reductase gamma subunit